MKRRDSNCISPGIEPHDFGFLQIDDGLGEICEFHQAHNNTSIKEVLHPIALLFVPSKLHESGHAFALVAMA